MCFPTTSGPGVAIDPGLLLAGQNTLAQPLSQAHEQGRVSESLGGDLKYKQREILLFSDVHGDMSGDLSCLMDRAVWNGVDTEVHLSLWLALDILMYSLEKCLFRFPTF